MVVDDDLFIREALLAIFQEEGYLVQVAEHGAQALALMEPIPPRVILLDLRMPVMDGWTFVREIRARGYRASLVVMTAAQDPFRWADELAADVIVPKPFDVDTLVQEVRRLSGKPEPLAPGAPTAQASSPRAS
jgi:CheY-like chemotaxis protein